METRLSAERNTKSSGMREATRPPTYIMFLTYRPKDSSFLFEFCFLLFALLFNWLNLSLSTSILYFIAKDSNHRPRISQPTYLEFLFQGLEDTGW